MSQMNKIIKIIAVTVLTIAGSICSLAYAQQTNLNNLPLCPGDQNARYHNCFGTNKTTKGGVYVGEFKDDKYHGQGTFTWASGDKYVGEFQDGKRDGHGTMTFANGVYVGEFKDDKYHGQGTFTWSSGDKYVGEFQDGKRNGQGAFTYANGDKYVGEYKDGERNGQGTLKSTDGDKYVGEFNDGKYHGKGILTKADGSKNEGIFKNGEFLGTKEDVAKQRLRVLEDEKRRYSETKEKNLSYPWRVQVQCARVDCQITRVEESDRLSDGAVRFSINYLTGTRTSGHVWVTNIDCGVGRSNKLQSNNILASCF